MKDIDKVADAIIHAPREKLIELVAALIAKATERAKALDERDKARAERDAAIAARDEAVMELATLRAVRNPQPATDTLAANLTRVNELRHAAERARDEVGIQLAAAQAEIARLRKRDAAFVAICLDVDNALDGSGLAPTAWLTRARLRFAAGVGPRPPSERLAEWAATIGASNASASHLDAFALDTVPGDALAKLHDTEGPGR